LGVLLTLISFTPILGPWIRALTGPWDAPSGDTLIVLGGDSISDQILGMGSYWRTVYAIHEWREGGFKEIVLSGGGGIAESMRPFIVSNGVPAEVIRMETASNTTREQALLVTAMLRFTPGRKVLLTSDYHSLRAYRAFRKCGLDVVSRPVPDAAKRNGSVRQRWDVFVDLVRETVKFAGYRLRGWV
jgi:uncharacterized SAM-binding protein YcdF (DUF218 family)